MKSHLEFRRNLVHIGLGVLLTIVLFYELFTSLTLLLILIAGFVTALLSKQYTIPLVSPLLKYFERPNTFPGRGALTFFVGALATYWIFNDILLQKDIALAAILVLTFGDGLSHIVGRFYGKRKHPLSNVKLLEGSIAGFVGSFLATLVFVPWPEALIGSFVAMIMEALTLKIGKEKIDDNITVPLTAAIVMYGVRFLL